MGKESNCKHLLEFSNAYSTPSERKPKNFYSNNRGAK